MKINSGSTPSEALALSRAGGVEAAPKAGNAPAAGLQAAALQSEVLQPALATLREMPEIDHQRVAELRDALAKGELPFDPARLAGLIQRFHGGN